MKRILLATVFAVVFMTTSVQAADRGPYFAVNGNFGVSVDLEEGPTVISFDPGYGFSGAVGYDLGSFRVEGEIGFDNFDVDEIVVGGTSFPVEGDTTLLRFMANGYYDIDMNSSLTPYVGLGLGVVRNDSKTTVLGLTFDEEATEFAYQAMLGVGFEITDSMVLTAGYRFFGTAEFDEDPMLHELTLGARFLF